MSLKSGRATKKAFCALQQVYRMPLLSSWNQQLQHAVFHLLPNFVALVLMKPATSAFTAAACAIPCLLLLRL